MKRLTFISILAGLLFVFCTEAQAQQRRANKDTAAWRYEIQNEAAGTDNSVIVCVWSYSKDVNTARKQATKNAVHGLIFKGAAGNSDASKRAKALKPLVSDPSLEQQHEAFFKSFFADGGEYSRYVSVVSNGKAGGTVKVGKEYKVAVYVAVQYDQLRKRLADEGLAQSLGGLFD